MFVSKLSHTLQVTKHWISASSIDKVCECKTLLFFHCVNLVSAVTQKSISTCPSPWHSHLLLRAALKTFQMHVLKKGDETCLPCSLLQSSVPPRELAHRCVCVTVSPGTPVQWGWCQILGGMFSSLSLRSTFPQLEGHGAGAEPWSLSLPYWIFISDFIKGTTVICHNRTY